MGLGKEAHFGISQRNAAEWKRVADLQSLFGHVKQFISLFRNRTNSLLLHARGKEMSRLHAQKGKKTDDASIRNALVGA